jgi:hypothetical protein
MTAAAEIQALLDEYGPPVPSLLPWLADWAAEGDLLQVARAAAAQAALAPMLRWPAVADAVAEVLARRAGRLVSVSSLVEILPQIAAHLDAAELTALLDAGPRPEALGYAALANPETGLLDRAGRLIREAPWPEILTAARTRAVPPLANLQLLAELTAGPPVRPGDLPGSDITYLLPFFGNEPDLAEEALAEIEDHLPAAASWFSTNWYACVLCARAVPYLDLGQRSRLSDSAATAPSSAWAAGVVRQLAEHHREPWPSATTELAAAHPAIVRLTELAEHADQAELATVWARIIEQIMYEYGDPDLERWESTGPEPLEAAAPPERAIRPGFQWEGQDTLAAPDDPVVPVRYLVGEVPETVRTGSTFRLGVRIALELSGAHVAALLPFDVPAEGRDVFLVLNAPGLRILGEQSQTLHVPRDEDSIWVHFSLQADAPGPHYVSVLAILDGTHLGTLTAEVTVEQDSPTGPSRRVRSEVGMEPVPGAVSLMARYAPNEKLYRFQFIADDFPSEIRHPLDMDPEGSIRELIRVLDDLAQGRRRFSGARARFFLANKGTELWQNLVPDQLRRQFWQRQATISQLTILADNDLVPWEMLYPKDTGHDHGFLVEQFPVTRAIFDRSQVRRLRLRPARFVLPPSSPPQAVKEVETLCELLGETSADAVVTELSALLDLLEIGDFGVLHFACHNIYDPVTGSAIKFGKELFTPDLLTWIAEEKMLDDSAPLVFVNACRAGGLAVSYNKLEGWATKFMKAGAAAFVGSQWAVADETAPEFAFHFYRQLLAERCLGEAVMSARKAISENEADPTWLAYSLYGDPRATIGQARR